MSEVVHVGEMKVTVISANLGGYDKPHEWVTQIVPHWIDLRVYRLTDETFPPRPLAMTSRLQVGIPKTCGWQLFPGADYYIWLDASCALLEPTCVEQFVDLMPYRTMQSYDIALFEHPDRDTIHQEYMFVREKLATGNKYLCSRYADEWIDEQYGVIAGDGSYVDDTLYASTAFIYHNKPHVQAMLWDWWAHKSRYLLHDQLALPYLVKKHKLNVRAIRQDYRKCDYMTFVRPSKRKVAA